MTETMSLLERATRAIPAGVNSPVRAFQGVGGDPIFIKEAYGAYLIDINNQKYIDYIGSWGPLIAGHAHPKVVKEVTAQIQRGLGYGAPTEMEVELAEKIKTFMPSIEMMRMVNSGTEATMSAIRLARGFTGKNKIIKFAGCYHGHSDCLLVEAGSGALTFGVPSSAGVPESIVQHTLVADYNQLETVTALFKKYGEDIAAVIVEPVAGNMNCVLPVPGFLKGLRALCDQYHCVLIFDEVMTGFRVSKGGATELYQIQPDLTTLGKIIGGGMPVGAYGGRADIMKWIAPLGPVYQAGTLSGNPVAMAAGMATLKLIEEPHFHTQLAQKTQQLMHGLEERANAAHIPFLTVSVCGMFGLYFTEDKKIETLKDVKRCNVERFKKFFHGMLQEGVYLAPSAFEAGFISSAHEEKEITATLNAAEKVFSSLCKPGL